MIQSSRRADQRPSRTATKQFSRRRTALVLLETLVAAVLVVATLSVATPMVIRSARIWKQTRHVQFANDELSGQMDRLIAMPADERREALEQLTVSPEIQAVLHDATMTGQLREDDDGKRIELKIEWQRTGTPEPMLLVAWIAPPPSATANVETPASDSTEPGTDSEDDQ